MEAIKAIAKKTKRGNYKIDLPNIGNDAEISVMIIMEDKPKNLLIDLSEYAGKMEWKGDPLVYQKMIRNEWD
jgi:hypothetical protein